MSAPIAREADHAADGRATKRKRRVVVHMPVAVDEQARSNDIDNRLEQTLLRMRALENLWTHLADPGGVRQGGDNGLWRRVGYQNVDAAASHGKSCIDVGDLLLRPPRSIRQPPLLVMRGRAAEGEETHASPLPSKAARRVAELRPDISPAARPDRKSEKLGMVLVVAVHEHTAQVGCGEPAFERVEVATAIRSWPDPEVSELEDVGTPVTSGEGDEMVPPGQFPVDVAGDENASLIVSGIRGHRTTTGDSGDASSASSAVSASVSFRA